MNNSPENLIALAKAEFPHPILVLTSSDNGRLWEMSECSKPLIDYSRKYSVRSQVGMKFRGLGWEIHLQEVEDELHRYYHGRDVVDFVLPDGESYIRSAWDISPVLPQKAIDEECSSCGETFSSLEQQAFDPTSNDHCPKCGERNCITARALEDQCRQPDRRFLWEHVAS